MNIVYLKYAVAVAKAGSLNKAAEELFVAQPNLSRAIKELERELGITVFERNSKGINLTLDGEKLVSYGKKILREIDELERDFTEKRATKTRFSVSAPRVSYISRAFAEFSLTLSAEERFEAYYKETNARHTIKDVLENDYKLGIVRYPSQYDRQFKDTFESKGLSHELIAEFNYVLITSKDGPLAKLDAITAEKLDGFIEIAHADPFAPSVSSEELKREELPDSVSRRIFVFERASQFDVLSSNADTYMWVSPVPKKLLDRYGLVSKKPVAADRTYRDVVIYPKTYKLSTRDKAFITALCASKRECFEE